MTEYMLSDLFDAVRKNDMTHIKKILLAFPKLIETADDDGIVPVFIAAECGHFELVKYLLEYSRVCMNVWDNYHRTILHYAARSNDDKLFDYLIRRINMDPLSVDLSMMTPLDEAIGVNCKNIIAYYEDELGITSELIYKNPVLSGTFPDPSIIRVEEDYYMVTSSFMFFPCIPILHSVNLIDWEIIGHAISDPTYIDLDEIGNGRGFWAPDISFNEGEFYITATYRRNDDDTPQRLQMVVHSPTPQGPYSKPSYIDEDGIDPSIFTDEDGRRYMLLNRGARIFEISKDGSRKLSDAKMLWYGHQKRAPEAPHLLKKDDYYYVFVSEGGTGREHQISVARSKTLMGPYEDCPYNPILIQRDPNHPIQRSGHGKLVQTNEGDWYSVYLCSRMIDQKWSILGRETALDPITWTLDGWPLFNHLKGPSGANIKPKIKSVISKSFKMNGLFGLSHEWHFVRMPKQAYIKVNGSSIKMVPGKLDLSHQHARNVLVRRQTDFKTTISVRLILLQAIEGLEAGITCYYDTNTYLKYYVYVADNGYRLKITERIGEIMKHTFDTHIYIKDQIRGVTLGIQVDGLLRKFFVIEDGSRCEVTTLDQVNYLCDEGIQMGKRFTGAMAGIYGVDASGSNQCLVEFNDFKMV